MSGETLAAAAKATGTGLAYVLSYHPLIALATVVIAAALAGARGAGGRRTAWAVAVVATGWLLGDGLRVLARARDLYDFTRGIEGVIPPTIMPGANDWRAWLALALWAAGGLLLGYALPVWTGAFVGRRVTHGTGWIAAASIAASVSFALSALAPAVVR